MRCYSFQQYTLFGSELQVGCPPPPLISSNPPVYNFCTLRCKVWEKVAQCKEAMNSDLRVCLVWGAKSTASCAGTVSQQFMRHGSDSLGQCVKGVGKCTTLGWLLPSVLKDDSMNAPFKESSSASTSLPGPGGGASSLPGPGGGASSNQPSVSTPPNNLLLISQEGK
jgi:hypothetical protein